MEMLKDYSMVELMDIEGGVYGKVDVIFDRKLEGSTEVSFESFADGAAGGNIDGKIYGRFDDIVGSFDGHGDGIFDSGSDITLDGKVNIFIFYCLYKRRFVEIQL